MIGEQLAISEGGVLRTAVAMMHATRGRGPGADSGIQGGDGETGIYGAADRVSDNPACIQDDGDVDEAGRNGDVGDVRHPELVGSVRSHVGREVGEDRLVVVAVRRNDVAPSLLRRQAMLAHEASHLLAVHEVALVAQLGGDATIAVGLELRADRLDTGEALGISPRKRGAVVSRSSDAHQPASLSDGDTAGPAITDIGALLGTRPCCRAPFRNSISTACRPTIRSSVAIFAS